MLRMRGRWRSHIITEYVRTLRKIEAIGASFMMPGHLLAQTGEVWCTKDDAKSVLGHAITAADVENLLH